MGGICSKGTQNITPIVSAWGMQYASTNYPPSQHSDYQTARDDQQNSSHLGQSTGKEQRKLRLGYHKYFE